MTMTKYERAEMEELRYQLRLARALRITPQAEPDVAIPERSSDLAVGFLPRSYSGDFNVVPACTSSCSHSSGLDDRTTSHGARRLYSSKLLALRACRNDAEQQCLQWLANIDKAIEDEERKSEK